jgi:hypothetical protein
MASGRPRASQRRWIFVEKPPHERPSAWPSCPLWRPRHAGGRGRPCCRASAGAPRPSRSRPGRRTPPRTRPGRASARTGARPSSPLAVPLRKRSPAGALARPPQDAVQDRPVVVAWSARPPALGRQERPDQLPLHVRQVARCHPLLPPPSKTGEPPGTTMLPFVHTAYRSLVRFPNSSRRTSQHQQEKPYWHDDQPGDRAPKDSPQQPPIGDTGAYIRADGSAQAFNHDQAPLHATPRGGIVPSAMQYAPGP